MKVLVIYATAGAGHRMAAQYIYDELKSSTGHEAVLVDSLDYTSFLFKTMYSGGYTFCISKIPRLWGFLFHLMDLKVLLPAVRWIRRVYNGMNSSALCRYLEEEQFDWIISTHFFGNEVAAHLKRTGRIKSRIVSVVTDYDVHSIWIANGIDYYTAATAFTKEKLHQLGVLPDRVVVTGIPTHPKFFMRRDLPALKKQLGLMENVFTVLVATGSFGIGPIEELVDKFSALPVSEAVQVAVVCGHNRGLYERLSRKHQKDEMIKIFSLVKNMDELMAVSNAMITKPGGLSVTEALVSGLPVIFFSAIPGQETNNINVLKGYGVGISGRSLEGMIEEIRKLRSSATEYQSVKERIKSVARPDAVKRIIGIIK